MTEEAQQLSPSTATPQQSIGPAFAFMTIALVLINVGVYIYQLFHSVPWIDPPADQLMAWGGNVAMLTLSGDPWRLATSVFVHGGLVHLLMNMYMLLLLGSLAEREFGRVGLLMLFLAGGVAASCTSAWWQSWHTLGTDFLGRPVVRLTVSVGASGAIMAIAGALLSAHVVRAWYSSDYATAPEGSFGKSLLQVVAINVGMGFLIPGVDNAAHIGGVVAGLVMGSSIQYAAEVAGSLLEAITRTALPLLLGAACAWALLQGSDWAEMRELRTLHDQQQQAEEKAANQQREAAGREHAAVQERQQLPAPVADDVARGQVIKFGESGTSFALSADGKTAYAVDHYQNEISVIDLASGTVSKRITGPQVPIKNRRGCMDIFCGSPAAVDIAVLQRRPLALVSSMQKDAVVFIDLASGQPSNAVAVGKTPNAILLSGDEKRAFVHNVDDNSISVIDVDKATTVRTLQLPKQHWPLSKPGRRLPMWLSSDGSRLFVAADGDDPVQPQQQQQIQVFDATALAPLASKETPYDIEQVIKPFGGATDVAALSSDGVYAMDDAATDAKRIWAFCSRLQATHVTAIRTADRSEYIAVADYRGYNGEDSLVHVANPQTLVTIGRYPITGVAMKLMMSADAKHVYAVTNGGEFVILDTRRRMESQDAGDLFCEQR
jgi:rhomboid protease GluP